MITHIVFDIDGTLTDGGIILSSDGIETKRFHVQDGQIINALSRIGIVTMFLTQRNSELTTRRASELNVTVVMQGVQNKADTLIDYFNENELNGNQFAYVGDDMNDYAAMKLCKFKACPIDAVDAIRDLCDYVSTERGGYGAVRDICEHLLRQQSQYDDFLNLYF